MRSSVHSQRGVAKRWLLFVIGVTLLAILAPFLIRHAYWLGRPMTNTQIERYLTHLNDPRETRHALSLVAKRIIRGDNSARQFYSDIIRLANCSNPQIREKAAWVMGQGNTVPAFHQTLLEMLYDPQPLVRMNAALALVRFRDDSGHAEILRMLSGEPLLAPESGVLKRVMDVGQSVHPDSVVAEILMGKQRVDVRAEVSGSLARWTASYGARVQAGQPIAVLAPSPRMAWEALRALYLIGRPDDLTVIAPYARGVAGMPARIARQARLTMKEIRSRSGS